MCKKKKKKSTLKLYKAEHQNQALPNQVYSVSNLCHVGESQY